MSPLGEAYRRALGQGRDAARQDSAGGKRSAAPAPQASAGGPSAPPEQAAPALGALDTLGTLGTLDARQAAGILSGAGGVRGFAAGPLRPGCDELAGLKAAVFAAGLDRPPATILVAGPMRGAGTTAVAVGLAGEIARDLSHRVLLVDADVRSPGVAATLGIDVGGGTDLADVLDARAEVGEAILHSEVDNLSALVLKASPASGASRLAAESLAGAAAEQVLSALEGAFDYVVIDAGATEESAAARVLARRASGVVLVLPAGVTGSRARASRAAVRSAGGRTLGVVLTGVSGRG